MKAIKANQRGFTLIEILVAVAVGALVVAAASGVIIQLLQSSRTSFHMTALRQVQTAGYWVSQDALQAESVITAPDEGFPLTLTPSSGDADIVYALVSANGAEQLERQGESTMVVARYLDSASCVWEADSLTFIITATVENQTETRTYVIQPRSLQS